MILAPEGGVETVHVLQLQLTVFRGGRLCECGVQLVHALRLGVGGGAGGGGGGGGGGHSLRARSNRFMEVCIQGKPLRLTDRYFNVTG